MIYFVYSQLTQKDNTRENVKNYTKKQQFWIEKLCVNTKPQLPLQVFRYIKKITVTGASFSKNMVRICGKAQFWVQILYIVAVIPEGRTAFINVKELRPF